MGFWIAIMGIMLWTTVRILQAALANKILEKRFSEWLSEFFELPVTAFIDERRKKNGAGYDATHNDSNRLESHT